MRGCTSGVYGVARAAGSVGAGNARLRAAMIAAGLTVDDLASKVEVDPKTVDRWLAKEDRYPHRRTRFAVAAVLGVHQGELWPEQLAAQLPAATRVTAAPVIGCWSGARAHALRLATRMTGEAFAAYLGFTPRMVTNWARTPALVPSMPAQQALDTALDRLDDAAVARFVVLLADLTTDPATAPAPEPVAADWSPAPAAVPFPRSHGPVEVA